MVLAVGGGSVGVMVVMVVMAVAVMVMVALYGGGGGYCKGGCYGAGKCCGHRGHGCGVNDSGLCGGGGG